MIQPISKTLSKSIMDSIEVDKIIYAEIAQPGAMGNAGGIIMYIPQASLREIISYETSIFEDEETYSLAYEKLHDHSATKTANNMNENASLDLYFGPMGNNVFVNKKANLVIRENFFVYEEDGLEFQIFSSVQGVFQSVCSQLRNPIIK